MTTELSIPEIADARLTELLQSIKPLVRVNPTGLHYIEPCDPRKVAFTWDPTPTTPANDLEPICTIRTLHTYGFYGFFKPSIAEVIAQIPEALLIETVAFETRGPQDRDDLGKESAALNAGFHVAQTTLYRRGQNT